MHVEDNAIGNMIFNWDPLWVSTILFIATYVVIVTEKVNRAIVAGIGAGLMVATGVLSQEAAISGIDFNTLGLLTGMMIIVAITRQSGVFQYLAIWSAKKVQARPWWILVVLSIVTAVLSALLDNVTTVLLIVPVTLLITEELKVNVYPFLFAEIFASNIGGTATLIGDPPNIMIGSAAGLSFNDFVLNVAPIVPLILVVTLAIVYALWGRKMHTTDEARRHIMALKEREAIKDIPLLRKSLFILGLVLIAFVFADLLRLKPATIAMFGAGLLLLLTNFKTKASKQSENVHHTFGEVEWITIFFFVGLFILVTGVEHSGLLAFLTGKILDLTNGDIATTAIVIMWMSAIASALLDNIPFVATMIPIIESMSSTFGGAEALSPLWWSLALGACLGGNGSLIGASANVIVAGYAERANQRIRFLSFMLLAFPLMILSISIATIYVYVRYL